MQNNDENGEHKIDLAKLFIVLMLLSAAGFGAGAVYLSHQEAVYAELVEKEDQAMSYIKRLAEQPDNKQYWGSELRNASRTTGVELPEYLDNKARSLAIKDNIDKRTTRKHTGHRDYTKTVVSLWFTDVTVERLVRYLWLVQKNKNDVFIESVKLSKFDYEQSIPTCSASVEVVIYEEPEKRSRSK
jgi:hypothetical protein